jgi:UDPglucose 6-dehydrogenase
MPGVATVVRMNISVIGTGRVGLVTGVALASVGHEVVGVDASIETVEMLQQGHPPFVEPGLDALLVEQLARGAIRFTGSVADALRDAQVAFICVGRPATPKGDHSMPAVESAARDVARHASDGIVVVAKSTVPPGTCDRIERTIRLERPELTFHVISSPEFLREGHALEDTLRPSRVVVGATSPEAFELMRRVYGPFLASNAPFIETDRASAELAKLASNAFLATKISFANALARLCEVVDADVADVTRVMGADPRIGAAFLGAGLGFGGYCLPKDVLALRQAADEAGSGFPMLEDVLRVNADAIEAAGRKIQDALWNLEGKRIALLGLAFKAGTDDVRGSPALALARWLLEAGADVVGCDPFAATGAKNELPQMRAITDPYEAAQGAHCLAVCTEWEQLRDLDLPRIHRSMAYPVVVDGRNVLDPAAMWEAGFHYIGTGRSYGSMLAGSLGG